MSDILQHTEEGVLTLTFNRLARKNAFSGAMYSTLTQALSAAATDSAVRVVLFQGHETVFTAGNDLEDFLKQPLTLDSPVFHFLRALVTFPKPMLAAVCGPAVGLGTTMLFHCDMVYGGDNAAFSMPFVNLGVCPEAGSSLLAPQQMGAHRAAEALLMCEPFMAEAALDMGLLNRVLPPAEVNAYAQQQARKLAQRPLSSLVATRQLLRGHQQQALLARVDEEGETFLRMLGEPAAREAMTAFMEKRKPDFSKC